MTTATHTVTPQEFRAELRKVVAPMQLKERLAFLQAFPELASNARLEDGRWFLPMDLVVQLGVAWRDVGHARNSMGGVYHLLPMWAGTDQSRARDAFETLEEVTSASLG